MFLTNHPATNHTQTIVQHIKNQESMLNIFKTKRKKITDDTLGTLTFKKSNRIDESYWNVDLKINSITELVEFYIYNNVDGINDKQKQLILLIESKYPELIGSLQSFLNEQIRKLDSDHSSISIEKDLDISFINIPQDPTELNKWEINYIEKKGFTSYGIEIENWNPIDLGVSA
ncbi:hypothetical protein [Aquimarina sp. MMG016]|uniref:hypothetical protein n=1 Tax=Aquimarina sp. MMG016 TaxID=2822690 RepID=UPI001B3A3625|nr:hypothetical protein [Aquimarina sp. MMG016]MBQ4820198.1 hypothetical protein [Aquimarina sp. MMG016]